MEIRLLWTEHVFDLIIIFSAGDEIFEMLYVVFENFHWNLINFLSRLKENSTLVAVIQWKFHPEIFTRVKKH